MHHGPDARVTVEGRAARAEGVSVRPEELAGALQGLMQWAHEHAPRPEPPVRRRLREHLGRDPRDLPIVSRSL
jgi:hypothetical protein